MDWTGRVSGLVSENEPVILIALSAIVLILIILSLGLCVKLRRLARRIKPVGTATDQAATGDIDGLARRVEGIEEKVVLLGEHENVLDGRIALAVQRVGLVRFDAFPDVGGEQSFALALTDRKMNGVVISNLYGRSDSRVYAKEVTEGQSQHALSEEEREALKRAGNAQR